MSAAEIIARIPKTKTEELRVSLDEYRGVNVLDLRVFADFTAASVKMPTKKGLTVAVGKLPELAEALRVAEQRARELGLIGEG